MNENKTLLTKEGIERLKKELNILRSVEYKECLEAIEDARGKGDPSENTEYDIAKERYENLNLKINKLSSILVNATIINIEAVNLDKVQILTTVLLKNKKTDKELKYTIVPEFEVNLKESKISINSPVAKSLIGKVIGDNVKILTPSGELELEILDIKI